MEYFRLGEKILAAVGMLALCISTASCTTGPTSDDGEPNAQYSVSPSTANTTSTDPTPETSRPVATATDQPNLTPKASATPTSSTTEPGTITGSNQGEIFIDIQASPMPPDVRCEGFAYNSDGVNSGGGALVGATLKLGSVSATVPTRVTLLPGNYEISIDCSFDSRRWSGNSEQTSVAGGQSSDLQITLSESK
ncbi:hypothetical protein [Arthrobacter sp. MYb224]|nr:hypothetical protein [Arthrobacter sp. MYb224]